MTDMINRRAALGRIAATASLALPTSAIAAAAYDCEAEIIRLSDKIVRRAVKAAMLKENLDPLHDHFVGIMHDDAIPQGDRWGMACVYSEESGHQEAVNRLNSFEEATDILFKRLMAMPAATQPGRAAKVRALIVHVMRDDWRGPAGNLDWDKEMARALLGEFAGLSATELDAI